MQEVICKFLGIEKYAVTLAAMQSFTKLRDLNTLDEIWFLEHEPVFTLGKSGIGRETLDNDNVPANIPIISSDRGGKITYHAPGQLIIYFLINLVRKSLSVKQLIQQILNSIMEFLNVKFHLNVENNKEFPGIYINGKKICSIGLKISKGCSYHGISLNIDMDLVPFTWINPCGISGLKMVQLKDFMITRDIKNIDNFTNNFKNDNNITVKYIAKLLKMFLLKNLAYVERKYANYE